jgi:hypothetical protein
MAGQRADPQLNRELAELLAFRIEQLAERIERRDGTPRLDQRAETRRAHALREERVE